MKRQVWHQLNTKVYKLVLDYLWEKGIERYDKKVRVEYDRYSKGKLDRDNLYASAKAWLDALKKIGVIVDDSDDWIDLVCTNKKGEARTEIRISPL